MTKKIGIFTSARSEYGVAKLLYEALSSDSFFEPQLLVGGGHFDKEQGYTVDEILKDGLTIAAKFDFLSKEKGAFGVSMSNAKLQEQFAQYLNDNPLDLIFLVGDRTELLPVAGAALIQNVAIAHISGGEVTEGAIDNQIRHAVTKMAHVHFVATQLYYNNVERMGEETWRICISGEPSLDNILSYSLPSKEEFLEKWNLNNSSPFVLSTFHSETILQGIGADFIEILTHSILNKTDFQILFTAANTDEGGILINQKLEALSEKNPRVKFVKSLGKTNYYAALKYADMVLGNSSSGLVEAQSFKVPVINVGSRQDGRLRNVNVFDVKPITKEILDAIAYVKTQSFDSKYKNHQNIYGDGQSLSRIVDFLKNLDWSKLLLKRSTFPTD